MVEVQSLTKHFGSITAVDSLSFSIAKGEIAGFLGPNGAGKSTTMRMLSCYMPPTSGTARIAGFDIFKDSIRAREHIGYMPESVPLPPDLRVREYLTFRAKLKGVPGRRIKERIADMCELCGLREIQHKLIRSLSKGYRQRVGLAEAIIHEPDLLILDEPTIGLDPNQIRQVRALIHNLSRHHTILLSTHILSEAESLCTRIIIISGGKIQAEGKTSDLRIKFDTVGRVRLEIRVPDAIAARSQILADPLIQTAEFKSLEDGWTQFVICADGDIRESLAELCQTKGWPLRELASQTLTLEEIFAAATLQEDF